MINEIELIKDVLNEAGFCKCSTQLHYVATLPNLPILKTPLLRDCIA